jgi:L-cysteine:1D-myo-inositol 2-amino-2-deoxy-alpha-D-glucopyranoside ligase
MRLYDTTRGEIVPFEPGPVVSMYSCGITPYDAAHVGHAQVYVTFDILQRRLIDLGHEPRLVRNVTDVDDDILRKARELGVHYLDLAAEEMARFDANMAALALLPVYREPRATSAIPDILSLIGAVLDAGHAYSAGGAVYFDISTFPAFGQVSHLTRPEMLILAAERGGRPDDPNKRDPLDFVLWQPSAPTSRRGSRAGGRAGRAGTSSVRRSPCESSGTRWTSTVGAPTSSSRTTSVRRRNRSR